MSPAPFLAALALIAGALPAAELPRSTPEAEGVSARDLLNFVTAADARAHRIHSVVVVRHGRIIAEGYWAPFTAGQHQMMYSLSKSFTSTAVGLAIAEGKIGLYDPVLKYFPGDAPEGVSRNLRSLRVHDLLRMSSGQSEAEIQAFPYDGAPNMIRAFLAMPVTSKPGTLWFYNSAATFMLSAIVQRATGQTVFDYLTPRLFAPLGFAAPTWELTKQGITRGYSGLRIRTRDIARFGQLMLQHGQWEGRQLVPADWVRAATSFQASNGTDPDSDWEQGYGYQFWRCRYGAVRGDGAYGQYCIMLPAQDAVVAITSGTDDMPAELSLVWTYLLPAFGPAPLPADRAADRALQSRLDTLTIPPVEGGAAAPADVEGRTYQAQLSDGPASCTFQGSTLMIRRGGHEERIPVAPGRWTTGPGSACSGAWVADHEFVLETQDLTLPFLDTLRLTFHGGEVMVSLDQLPRTDDFHPLLGVRATAVPPAAGGNHGT